MVRPEVPQELCLAGVSRMNESRCGGESTSVQKPKLDVLYGPLRILPVEQLLSLVDGSGINTPKGRVTVLEYCSEEVYSATGGIRQDDFYTDFSRFSHDKNRDYATLVLRDRDKLKTERAVYVSGDYYRELEADVKRLNLSEVLQFTTKNESESNAGAAVKVNSDCKSLPNQEDGVAFGGRPTRDSPTRTDSLKARVEGFSSTKPGPCCQQIQSSASRRPLPPLPQASGQQSSRTLTTNQIGSEQERIPGPPSSSSARVNRLSVPNLCLSADSLLQCPHEQAGYCRSWNIAHQNCCSYSHRFTYNSVIKNSSGYVLRKFIPGSPEFDYIKIRFINSWIHPTVRTPKVTKVYQVSCPELEALFNDRKRQIELQTGNKANVTELYHGTCEAYFETIFTQGFLPPADYEPHPLCPISGPYHDKLSTSLCNRNCNLCVSTPRHTWNMCHMWGLGIYCAMQSSKSDIYVSNKKGKKNDRSKRKMLICSVILGQSETVERLSRPDGMHERILPSRGKHSIYVIGSKNRAIPSTANGHKLAVVNDEYILFHSHQMLPLYIVEYNK